MAFKQEWQLKPSYLLGIFLIFIYGGAILILLFLLYSWWVALPIIIFLGFSLSKNLRLYALQLNPNTINKFWHKDNNEWLLQTRNKEIIPAQLTSNSYCSLYLMILNFKMNDKKKIVTVLILLDSMPTDTLRRLRAELSIVRIIVPHRCKYNPK